MASGMNILSLQERGKGKNIQKIFVIHPVCLALREKNHFRILLCHLSLEDEISLLVIVVDVNPIWWGQQAQREPEVKVIKVQTIHCGLGNENEADSSSYLIFSPRSSSLCPSVLMQSRLWETPTWQWQEQTSWLSLQVTVKTGKCNTCR